MFGVGEGGGGSSGACSWTCVVFNGGALLFLRHRIEGFGGSGGTGVAVPTGGRGRGGDSPSPMLDGAPIGPLLVKSRGGGVGSGRGGLARWFGGVRYTSLGGCLPGAALGVPDVPLPSVCPATRGFLVHGPLGGSPVRVHPSRGLASVRDRRARRRRDRVGVLNAALADGRGGVRFGAGLRIGCGCRGMSPRGAGGQGLWFSLVHFSF